MKERPEINECPGVYPPREDSYLLLESISVEEGDIFLDMGTGTGIIGIAAAMEGAMVYASDIEEKALRCALSNAERNGVDIEAIRSDMFSGIRGKFDVVAFNPPYLPESGREYQGKEALESPEGGAYHIRRFIAEVPGFLKEGGRAYFVISSHTALDPSEIEGVRRIAEKHMFFENIYVFMLPHKKNL